MLFHLSAMIGEFDPGSFFSEVVSSAVCCNVALLIRK